MGSELRDLPERVKSDLAARQSGNDSIGRKISELRRQNLKGRDADAREPAYRGMSFGVMACAMEAAWTYGQLSGRDGDDFEYWFRQTVDRCYGDRGLAGMDPLFAACAEFVVEQVMAIANEPYQDRPSNSWLLDDLAKLCGRLAEIRRRGQEPDE